MINLKIERRLYDISVHVITEISYKVGNFEYFWDSKEKLEEPQK